MLKLGQIINPNVISALNKIASLDTSVAEAVAYAKFIKFAQVALKDWQELLTKFKDKVDAKDVNVLKELETEWAKEVEVPKMPVSILGKFEKITPNEYMALEDVCE